jgi:hypothetical protein
MEEILFLSERVGVCGVLAGREQGSPNNQDVGVSGQRELLSVKEKQELDVLEDEVTGFHWWGFESDDKGCWMGVEPRVMTLRRMQEEAIKDALYQTLVKALPDDPLFWPLEVKAMGRYSDKLSAVDGVLMYGDRVLMPRALRQEVLDTLHLGHQGVTGL